MTLRDENVVVPGKYWSWYVFSHEEVAKCLDEDAFSGHRTGIPKKEVCSVFEIHDTSPRFRDVVLVYGDQAFDARIDLSNGRCRLKWGPDFAGKIARVTKGYQPYHPVRNPDRCVMLYFHREASERGLRFTVAFDRMKPEVGKKIEEEAASVASQCHAQLSQSGRGQGFLASVGMRTAIELHAMKRAKRYFKEYGYAVEDTSRTESYDLQVTKNAARFYVEVKGTTTDGEHVFVTKNEVRHAHAHRDLCKLFVVHHIDVDDVSSESPKVTGGINYLIEPWNPSWERLTCLAYRYDVVS